MFSELSKYNLTKRAVIFSLVKIIVIIIVIREVEQNNNKKAGKGKSSMAFILNFHNFVDSLVEANVSHNWPGERGALMH